MVALIESPSTGVPACLVELRRLGRTLTHRAANVLDHFDRPLTRNGPIETVNGRLEHVCGFTHGFRNVTNASPAHSSRPATSGGNHTLERDEPDTAAPHTDRSNRPGRS